ncbi:MAG TPA: AIR synthase related protein, partial [Chthoniobacterales bacterium]
MKLSRIGEDALIASFVRELPASRKFIGDDCAVVEFRGAKNLLVLKTDCVVERIHFESRANPELVGWKAMMRALSDFAAVSALPQFALITIILPRSKSASWVKKLYRGLKRAAAKFDVAIVGGETSATRGP